jgi:hypothetical protein
MLEQLKHFAKLLQEEREETARLKRRALNRYYELRSRESELNKQLREAAEIVAEEEYRLRGVSK